MEVYRGVTWVFVLMTLELLLGEAVTAAPMKRNANKILAMFRI